MVKLVTSGPLLLTRFEPRESLHPELKHQSLTAVIQDLSTREGHVKRYDNPLPPHRQNAYSDMGQLWENALEQEFKKRQGKRAQQENSELVLQHKICFSDLHMIPDGHSRKIGHEYKLSFQAMPSSPDKLFNAHQPWLLQTQCYAHVLGIYEWHFYVCWCHRWPDPVHYQFKYDRKECKQTFTRIKEHAELMRKRASTLV